MKETEDTEDREMSSPVCGRRAHCVYGGLGILMSNCPVLHMVTEKEER